MLSRACWQTALKKGVSLTGQRAGGEEHGPGGHGGIRGVELAPGSQGGKTPPKADAPKLHGPPLTGKEGARSLDHRPKERKTGKYLCWDFISQRGCKVPSCPHAHVSPPKWDSLDWSVQLQLLRRGGVKSKAACTPAQLVDQMEGLRKSVKDKLADNVAEGKKSKADKAKQEEGRGRRKVGQQPPEEFTTFHPTDQEERLHEWTAGAGNLFYEDSHLDLGARVATSEDLREEVAERRAAMNEVDGLKLSGGE